MRVALLSLALLGQPVTTPVSDKVPVLNVEALCKATVEDDKAMGLTEAQSFSGCMDDEKQAQQQVSTMWATSLVMFAINARLQRRRGAAKVTSISSRVCKPHISQPTLIHIRGL